MLSAGMRSVLKTLSSFLTERITTGSAIVCCVSRGESPHKLQVDITEIHGRPDRSQNQNLIFFSAMQHITSPTTGGQHGLW